MLEERRWQMEIAHQPTVSKRSGGFLGSPLALSHGEESSQSYLALGRMSLWVRPRREGMGKPLSALGILSWYAPPVPLGSEDTPDNCCQFGLTMSTKIGQLLMVQAIIYFYHSLKLFIFIYFSLVHVCST